MEATKKPDVKDFTESQKELLRALATDKCNIALYREGLVRMRDTKHNPLKNIRKDLFDKIKEYVIRGQDGLYRFDESKRHLIPESILR